MREVTLKSQSYCEAETIGVNTGSETFGSQNQITGKP